MESLIERWKKTINSSERKSQHTNSSENTIEHTQNSTNNNSSLKKSAKKKKRKNSEKQQSPIKTAKSHHTQTEKVTQEKGRKQKVLEQFSKRIMSIKGEDKIVRIQSILEELWSIAEENTDSSSLPSQTRDTPSKIHSKLYSDLQNRYFIIQKEKQSLKAQLQDLVQRFETSTRQNDRLLKVQKLVDNCIRREDLLNKQIDYLRNQLNLSQQKQKEQQRIFKKEVLNIHNLIEDIKGSLPT